MVIDGTIRYTGGFGIADEWYGDGHQPGSWLETNVRVVGPAVLQMQAALATVWLEATGELRVSEDDAALTAATTEGAHRAGFLLTTPAPGLTPAERLFLLSIGAARERLYISSGYFAPDDDLVDLLTAATGRGVDVRVLTVGKHTDVPVARWAGRARYAELLERGVRIYEFQPTMMHVKTFVDGLWSSIGTMNFDHRSVALNAESALLLLDRELGRTMEEIFHDDLRDAAEVLLERFRRRPWRDRGRERAAELVAKLA